MHGGGLNREQSDYRRRRGPFHYSGDPSNPFYLSVVWRMVAIGIVATTGLLAIVSRIGAHPYRWSWLVAGIACLVVFGASQGFDVALGVRSRGRRVTAPAKALVDCSLVVVATGLVTLGLGQGVVATSFVALFPIMLMGMIGSRFMLGTTLLVSLGVAVGVGAVEGGADLAVLYLAVPMWVAVAAMAAMIADAGVRGVIKAEQFAGVVSIAGRATELDAGLDVLLPALEEYLEADGLAVLATDGRVLRATGAAVETLTDADLADLARAGRTGRPVVGAQHSFVHVDAAEGGTFVLCVSRRWRSVTDRLMARFVLGRAGLPASVLLSRTALIAQLREMGTIDGLTGVPNRRALDARLDHEVAVSDRSRNAVSVAMVDLDHFKRYNDTHGHLAGDEALVRVAHLLRSRTRATDFVARFGGEEFCVVLPATPGPDAARVLDEVRVALEATGGTDGSPRLTFSAGVAEWRWGDDAMTLVQRADAALYDSKLRGRARVRVAELPDAPAVIDLDDGAATAEPPVTVLAR